MEESENVVDKKNNFFVKNKTLLLEILRFLIVGGGATLIEWVIAWIIEALMPEVLIGSWSVRSAIATTAGFMISLVFNYFLSLIFVYKNKKDENSGKSFKDFMVFFLISICVLAFQLLFLFLVKDLLLIETLHWETIIFGNLTWAFVLTKAFATIVGLVANYILRKIFIFK